MSVLCQQTCAAPMKSAWTPWETTHAHAETVMKGMHRAAEVGEQCE